MLKVNPALNGNFKGAHFHHLHLNEFPEVGIHIPRKLHSSINHSSKTGRGMREMNKAALLWLCEQSVLVPDRYRASVDARSASDGMRWLRAQVPKALYDELNIKSGAELDDVITKGLRMYLNTVRQ